MHHCSPQICFSLSIFLGVLDSRALFNLCYSIWRDLRSVLYSWWPSIQQASQWWIENVGVSVMQYAILNLESLYKFTTGLEGLLLFSWQEAYFNKSFCAVHWCFHIYLWSLSKLASFNQLSLNDGRGSFAFLSFDFSRVIQAFIIPSHGCHEYLLLTVTAASTLKIERENHYPTPF